VKVAVWWKREAPHWRVYFFETKETKEASWIKLENTETKTDEQGNRELQPEGPRGWIEGTLLSMNP